MQLSIQVPELREHSPVHVTTDAGAFTFSLGGLENYSFDGEGRLVGAWREKVTYRRALDNRMLAKWIDPNRPGRRVRRMLGSAERGVVLEEAYRRAETVAGALRKVSADKGLVEWLERIAKWDLSALEKEAERFAAVYKPVPILPPDQYLSLVIQATEGCSYNECTFCTLYRDRSFRIKGQEELAAHVEGVRDFIGRGMALRRSVFLSDANAVIVAQSRLLPMLEALNETLPMCREGRGEIENIGGMGGGTGLLDGFYSFVSAPDALHKSARDFAEMKQMKMKRVYVGLESGHDPLRRFLRKQGGADDVRRAVESIRAGGVAIGLICMVGIGGERFRDGHFADTCELLARLPLEPSDLVYLSPFVSSGDAPYDTDLIGEGIKALDEDAMVAEEARFKRALAPIAKAKGFRVSRYDVREFVY